MSSANEARSCSCRLSHASHGEPWPRQLARYSSWPPVHLGWLSAPFGWGSRDRPVLEDREVQAGNSTALRPESPRTACSWSAVSLPIAGVDDMSIVGAGETPPSGRGNPSACAAQSRSVCVDVMLPAEPPCCCQLVDRCLGEDRPLVGEPNMPLRVVREPARRRPCLRYAATRGSLDRGNQLWLDRPTLSATTPSFGNRAAPRRPPLVAADELDRTGSASRTSTRRPCSGRCSTRGGAAGSSSRRRRRSPSSERTSRGRDRRVRGRAEPAREDGRHGRRAGRLGLTSARTSTSRRHARSACFCPP